MAIVHLTKVERGQLKDMGPKLRELSEQAGELTAGELAAALDQLALEVEWLADAFEIREELANPRNH